MTEAKDQAEAEARLRHQNNVAKERAQKIANRERRQIAYVLWLTNNTFTYVPVNPQ